MKPVSVDIAKRQPTASDLRLIMAISKPSPNWERIGMWRIKLPKPRWKNFHRQHQPLLVGLESPRRHSDAA